MILNHLINKKLSRKVYSENVSNLIEKEKPLIQ
jgi:hypothetical protein